MKTSLVALTISISLFLPCWVGAQAEPAAAQALMTPEEEGIRMRAKKRLYPGGRDEESLRVQTQLSIVTRKMSPTTEAPADEPANSDPAND